MAALGWNNEDMDTLFTTRYAEDDMEKATVPWALANMELSRGKKVHVTTAWTLDRMPKSVVSVSSPKMI
eukprot:3496663-Rhodomonas_salina.4